MHFHKKTFAAVLILSIAFLIHSCSDSGTGTDPDQSIEFNSQAAPGDSAQSFLENDQYTSLRLEIDYMPGHEPTQAGLDSLEIFLQQRLNKQTITISTPTQVESGGQNTYSADNIRSLEEQHRDNYTKAGSNTLQVYFLYVDGEFEQSNVLGIAYFNTSMAFFGQTIEDVSSGIGAPSEQKIEGTVFRHEFGHNMGLVGNGSPTLSDHKTNGSAHCTTDGCLMEPAVETGNFFTNTFDGSIPELDQLCVDDLQANGGR